MKLFHAIQFFMKKCNANNLRPKTIESYSYHLKPFFLYMSDRGWADTDSMNADCLLGYFADISKSLGTVTVKGRFVVIKLFFSTLYKAGIVDTNPFKALKAPKVSKRLIAAFSNEEIQELLNGFDKTSYLGYRNYSIMAVLFGTGMRKSELLQLSFGDILADTDAIKVIGKGDKERIIPISPVLKSILRAYLRKRKEHLNDLQASPCWSLWLSRRGTPLTASGLNMLFRQLKASKRQWSTRVSAHTWRHTFAKLYLLNGGDLFTLQKILGHEDITTTRLYLDMNIKELKQQNDKFNPLDNQKWQYY